MTSSFGTVIGTPRDKLPNIGDTNYDRTSPDLTDAVNKQIDRNILDTKDFFADMMKYAQLRYDNRDDNIKALANLTSKAVEFKKASEQAEKVAEIKRGYKTTLNEIEAKRQKGLPLGRSADDQVIADNDQQVVKAGAELVNEDTVESKDLAVVITKQDDEELGIRNYSTDNLNFGAVTTYANKNDWYNKGTSVEGEAVWDDGEDLFLMTLYDKAEAQGINTDGSKWRRHMLRKILPEMRTRKEKAMLEWEGIQKRKIINNLNDRKDAKINEMLSSEDDNMNTEELIQYVMDASGPNFTRTDAITYIGNYMYNSLANKDGRVTIAMAEDFKSRFLFKVAGKVKDGKPVYTTFQESNFGKNGEVTAQVIRRINRGIDLATVDQSDVDKKKLQRFQNEVIDPLREEDGSITDANQLRIAAEYQKEFPGKTLPENLQNQQTRTNTGNKFGTNYGALSIPGEGNPALAYQTDLEQALLIQYREQTGLNVGKLPQLEQNKVSRAVEALRQKAQQAYGGGDQGFTIEQALTNELGGVTTDLLAGKFDLVIPTFRTGGPQDIVNDATYFNKDKSNINLPEFASTIEKVNLETARVQIQNGNIGAALTSYWKNVAKKVGMPAGDFLLQRLEATGGIDKTGNVVEKGIYKLDAEDFTNLHRNPNPHSSIDVFYKENSEGDKNSTIMLNAARVKGSDGLFVKDGTYQFSPSGNRIIRRTDGDTLTLKELYEKGATNIGRYKIPYKVLKELMTYGPDGKPILGSILNKPFDENSQSIVMSLFWHKQLQDMNSIRGVEIDGLFPWTSSTLSVDEQELVKDFMPALKETPYFSQPNTIQSDVMNAIMSNEELQQNQVFFNKIPFDKFKEFTTENNIPTSIVSYNQLTPSQQKNLLIKLKLKKQKTDFGFDLIPIDTPNKVRTIKKRTRR